MAHPLDGAQLKLARADTHLKLVKSAIEEMIGPDAELIPGEFDAEGEQYVFRAQRDSWHPDWLAPAIGDCVHNLRAALDYIVWELVRAAGHVGSTSTEFPIFTDPKLYARFAPKKLRGIDPRAQTVIERSQPFAGPNSQPAHPGWRDPEFEPLALLYGLDIWDKHRSLNLTEDALALTLVIPPEYGIYTSGTPFTLPGRFKRGAIIGRLHAAKADMHVHLSARTHIVFERDGPAAGEDVIKTLNHIRQEVRTRVLPAFAEFFPKP